MNKQSQKGLAPLNSAKQTIQSGFSLIEILVVIGLIAILAAVVLIAINPARQFAQGRDSQRISNLNSLLNAIGQRIADGKGNFTAPFRVGTTDYVCPSLPVGSTTTDAVIVASGALAGAVNLSCLVPTYIPALPTDPTGPTAPNTGYAVYQESIGRVHVIATST